MSSSDNTSTLQSYIDSATGAAQSLVGSLTGNPADKAQAQDTKDKAAAEHDLSSAAVKAGPFTASASGGVAKDNSDRTSGSYNQTVGSAKEALGNLTGAESLRQSGAEQNAVGKEQEAKGQLTDLGQGVSDRVSGAVGGAVAGLTGDRESRDKYDAKHDEGKARQRGVEADLQKQVPQ